VEKVSHIILFHESDESEATNISPALGRYHRR